MALQSLPASTGAPCSASMAMASSSSTFCTVVAHGRFLNATPSAVHSLNAEMLSSDMIPHSEVSEQPLWGDYHELPAEATHFAYELGGLLNNDGINSVEEQPDSASVRDPNESQGEDEWLTCLVNESSGDVITTDMTSIYPQMAEHAPVSTSLNSGTCLHEHILHPLVSVPTIPGQLYPIASPPATTNVHSPQRIIKVRRRWTKEMHDRFIDAVNQLGGCENAKPKAILDIMNVEGLTRDQVKSHLQKYKLAQVRHRSSEVAGTSVETMASNEAIPSSVQRHIQEFALQVQIDLQKKLHEMVERTRHDLLEIHRRILENHVMSVHELEERQSLNADRRTDQQ